MSELSFAEVKELFINKFGYQPGLAGVGLGENNNMLIYTYHSKYETTYPKSFMGYKTKIKIVGKIVAY